MWDVTDECEQKAQLAAEEQQVADNIFDLMCEQEEQFSMYEQGNYPF